MVVRLLYFLLAALLIITMAACNRLEIPSDQTAGGGFQKNMRQSKYTYILDMCETDAGAYLNYNGFLYFLDKESKRATVLCGKPDCEHKNSDCGAWINTRGMWYGGDKLYCVSYAKGNGGKFVTSLNPDGTDRRTVQELQYEANGVQSSVTGAIYYRGDVYYVWNDVLYHVPLGGDREDAEALWGEENGGTSGGTILLTGDELRFTLWADGDNVYFMVNLKGDDGTRRDTLFACHITDGTVSQVWRTPDKAEVGDWDTAGVSVSSWYVLDGYIYFYLSGNGLWRSGLPGGEPELLADTGKIARYGTALFSDTYMCLLNDLPNQQGGDTIFVYDLNGALQKELPLKPLADEAEGITGFAPLFISDSELYFVAHAGARGDIVNGVQYEDKNDILCCIDLKTGEITRICNWH